MDYKYGKYTKAVDIVKQKAVRIDDSETEDADSMPHQNSKSPLGDRSPTLLNRHSTKIISNINHVKQIKIESPTNSTMEDRAAPKSSILPKRITYDGDLLDGKKLMKRNESGAGNIRYRADPSSPNDIF